MENNVVLEFEDNWGKRTESKAPDKPVRVAPPVVNDYIEEVDDPSPVETATPAASTPAEVAPAEKKGLSASFSAELTVMGIDTMQSIVFKLINSRKITKRIGKHNLEKFSGLLDDLKDGKKALDSLDESDRLLFYKFKRLKEIESDIPLTDAEYDKLTKVLEKYYEESGKSMPPWFGLSIALTDIIGARLADALTE